jgi:hypothetical protein
MTRAGAREGKSLVTEKKKKKKEKKMPTFQDTNIKRSRTSII